MSVVYWFQYLDDLECPHDPTNRAATLDWLLGYAVRLEYGDNGKYVTPIMIIGLWDLKVPHRSSSEPSADQRW